MKNSGFSAFSKRPLAAAVFSLFGLASLEAAAAPAVTNCSDAGTGSLRAAVSGAAEGDFIDMTHLSCSTISLSTGSIHILRNNLTIAGPGRDKLTINVANNGVNNVLSHYGTGTLEVDSVKISGGHFYMTSSGKYFGGGCIGSFGSLRLNFDEVSGCAVTAGDNAYGRGGAIFAAGDVHVVESVIDGNVVNPAVIPPTCVYLPSPGGYEYCYGGDPRTPTGLVGGGVFAKGDVTLEESLVTGNSAYAGGGVFASGGQVLFSTLSSNEASTGAAMLVTGKSSLVISGSTMTENHFPSILLRVLLLPQPSSQQRHRSNRFGTRIDGDRRRRPADAHLQQHVCEQRVYVVGDPFAEPSGNLQQHNRAQSMALLRHIHRGEWHCDG